MASSNPSGSSVSGLVLPKASSLENEAEPDEHQTLKTQLRSLIQADKIAEVEELLNRNKYLANASILYEAEKNQQPVKCPVLPLTITAIFGRVTILEMLLSKFNVDVDTPHSPGSPSPINRNLTGGETRSRFAQPQSIHMFIEQVLGITTGFSEWPIVGLKTSLDVFRESIRKVVGAVHRDGDIILHILKSYQANAKAELFKVFRDALEAERGQQHDSPRRSGHAVKAIPSNPYHIISPETTLLEKIRDI